MLSRHSICTEIQVLPTHAECSRVRRVISRLALSRLRDSRSAGDVELAVGEAFTNVVKYGAGGKVSVLVDASSADEFVVELNYPGKSFETAVTHPRNRTGGHGGYGRYIMQECLDGMEYRFLGGRTRLRMSKRVRR